MPIRQMQTLLSDKKPNDIATPLHLTPAPLAPLFMPTSPPCIATTAEKQEVLLPQQLWGKLTFLHLSYNQFAFDLGRKWCEAANQFAAQPLTTPATSPTPSSPPLANSASASTSASTSASSAAPPAVVSSVDVSPFDYYQISLIKNPFVRHWFGDYSLSSFRSTTPPHMHRHLLSLLSDHSYATLTAQEPLLQLVRHELLGFVFLLDARSRIRWRAWGTMTDEDREVMGRVIAELREEDARERRKEVVERMRSKEVAAEKKGMMGGVRGGRVYDAGKKVNGQATNVPVNGGLAGGGEAERHKEEARTVELVDEKTDVKGTVVAKG